MKEYWLNGRKVAFTTSYTPGFGFSKVGDVQVMEETIIGIGDDDPPSTIRYQHTASFIVMGDAVTYLRGKYPAAEERMTRKVVS
jgi:hypothetical protein